MKKVVSSYYVFGISLDVLIYTYMLKNHLPTILPANNVSSASVSTERIEIEILLGSTLGFYCRFIPSER